MQHCNEHVRGEMQRLERKINNNIYIKCRRSLIVKLICECLSLSCSGYKEWFRDVSYITSVIKIQSAGRRSRELYAFQVYFARSKQTCLFLSRRLCVYSLLFGKKQQAHSQSLRMPFLPIT